MLLLLRRFSSPRRRNLSTLLDRYGFIPPTSLTPTREQRGGEDAGGEKRRRKKPPYRPPSSLDRGGRPAARSDHLPFDFRFSYTESSPGDAPIGLREPKYSPFGPGRLDRPWTGLCAPAVDTTLRDVAADDPAPAAERGLEEARRRQRERVLGGPLTPAEKAFFVAKCQKSRTKRQINLGRDGLTHNMLNDIHNHWKNGEAVRVKCLGVPTVDMQNVCHQLEDKTGGIIIHRHGGQLILYRGRHYNTKKRPVIPLMLWKPAEPVYPRLIKTTIEGLTVEETKEMRKKGLHVPVLTKLGLPKSDYRKIGVKLRDIVPCIIVSFDKEQIIVWRGKEYNETLQDHTHNTSVPVLEEESAGVESENVDQEQESSGWSSDECSQHSSSNEVSDDKSVISEVRNWKRASCRQCNASLGLRQSEEGASRCNVAPCSDSCRDFY
uniref:CRM domain-containing protein n=1 Tax=Leersia perrieri TaxID=77586 RepID=A0A0D9X4X2_9ORYZ